jgi:hypothetical protein
VARVGGDLIDRNADGDGVVGQPVVADAGEAVQAFDAVRAGQQHRLARLGRHRVAHLGETCLPNQPPGPACAK